MGGISGQKVCWDCKDLYLFYYFIVDDYHHGTKLASFPFPLSLKVFSISGVIKRGRSNYFNGGGEAKVKAV
jgi:hypothetical protein